MKTEGSQNKMGYNRNTQEKKRNLMITSMYKSDNFNIAFDIDYFLMYCCIWIEISYLRAVVLIFWKNAGFDFDNIPPRNYVFESSFVE